MKKSSIWLTLAVMSFLGALDAHDATQPPHPAWWVVLIKVACITGVITCTSAYTQANIAEKAERRVQQSAAKK